MDALEMLEQKINKAVTLIDKLTTENNHLAEENARLKNELIESEKKLSNLEQDSVKNNERIKDKLSGILNKLDILEQM